MSDKTIHWVENSHLSVGWYWSDETGDMHGPYEEREQAVEAQYRYAVEVLGV